MKSKRIVLVAAILLFSFFEVAHASNYDDYVSESSSKNHYNGGLYVQVIGFNVPHMPLVIRDVPVHKEDSWCFMNAGPIKHESYDISPIIVGNFNCGRSLLTEKFVFGLGMDLLFDFFPQIEERNYMGAVGTEERGEGTALTFCYLSYGGPLGQYVGWLGAFEPYLSFEPYLFSRFDFTEGISLEARVGYGQIKAISGWDRYNRLEVWKNFILANCIPVTFQVEIAHISFGWVLPNEKLTGAGKRLV